MISRTIVTATAQAIGQSLLLKNSSQSVRPIICVCGPPSSSGITYSPTQGMKTSIAPATMPARDSGTVTFQNAVQARRAEIGGGLEQAQVHLRQVRVERQDHERQVGVGHAEDERERRVHQLARRRESGRAAASAWSSPSASIAFGDRAVLGQQRLPGVDAQQERGPERQHHEHQQGRLERSAARAP